MTEYVSLRTHRVENSVTTDRDQPRCSLRSGCSSRYRVPRFLRRRRSCGRGYLIRAVRERVVIICGMFALRVLLGPYAMST